MSLTTIRHYYGIDFGTSNVALAHIGPGGSDTDYLAFDSDDRPTQVHDLVDAFLKDHMEVRESLRPGPSKAIIEGVFHGKNARTFERMVRVSQSLVASLGELGIDPDIVNASSWRRTLFSPERKTKEECIEWALRVWPELEDYPKKTRSHRADALMIALTGAVRDGAVDLSELITVP